MGFCYNRNNYIHAQHVHVIIMCTVHACVQVFICTCTLHLPTISIITKRMIPIIPANSNHNYSKEWKYNSREVIHTQYIFTLKSHMKHHTTPAPGISYHTGYMYIQYTCAWRIHVHVLYMYMWTIIRVAFDQPILPKGQILTCTWLLL